MSHFLVFTGNTGLGSSTAAAATAIQAARQGQHTLLLSLGSVQSLSSLLGTTVGANPSTLAAGFDALAIDPLAELSSAWEQGRNALFAQLGQIASDELPLIPGLEISFGLLRLRELAARYALIVIDAGPYHMLLRALAVPDSLRWTVRQLFGLDRGPGRSMATLDRALLPTSFIPTEIIDNIQNIRVQVEQLRDLLLAPGAASARFVLQPNAPALAEARLALPALQLHGLAVPEIVVGPLLPDSVINTPLAPLLAHQQALLAEISAVWPTQHLQRFELQAENEGLAVLGRLGEQMNVDTRFTGKPPIAERWEDAPALVIELPGLPKGVLQLTLSGDELIVRVGAYRRHLLLPEGLRGRNNIKATREAERLIIRQRG